MKKLSRKLNLNRETLIPLTPDTLDGIHGGITPTITITTDTMPSRSQISACLPPTQTRIFCTQTSLPNK